MRGLENSDRRTPERLRQRPDSRDRRWEPTPGKRRAVLILWFLLLSVVTALSLLPASLVPRHPGEGRPEHFVAYFVLALIPFVAVKRSYHAYAAALAVACLGVLLEVLQMRIPGRAFEWADILMNCTGVTAGVLAGLPLRTHVVLPEPAPRSGI